MIAARPFAAAVLELDVGYVEVLSDDPPIPHRGLSNSLQLEMAPP